MIDLNIITANLSLSLSLSLSVFLSLSLFLSLFLCVSLSPFLCVCVFLFKSFFWTFIICTLLSFLLERRSWIDWFLQPLCSVIYLFLWFYFAPSHLQLIYYVFSRYLFFSNFYDNLSIFLPCLRLVLLSCLSTLSSLFVFSIFILYFSSFYFIFSSFV